MNKIKKIFSFIKELILSGFSVFMIGEDYEGIDVLSVEEPDAGNTIIGFSQLGAESDYRSAKNMLKK